MDTWEYRQEELDFRRLTVIRKDREIPVSDIRFWYFNYPEKNTKGTAQVDVWQTIRPIVMGRVNALGSDGWELISPLDLTIAQVHDRAGRKLLGAFCYVLGFTVIGLPLAIGLGYIVPSDYLAVSRVTLSFRRLRKNGTGA